MSYFSVAPSSGSYRDSLHPYKFLFQMKTKVQSYKSSLIPTYGFSFTKIAEICSHTSDYDYLVDVISLLTGILAEREYINDGKITKMVVLELTNDRIVVQGVEPSDSVAVLGSHERPSMDIEFLCMYPKKTIAKMKDLDKDGTFVVSAVVEGMVQGEEWWYPLPVDII